MVIYLTVYLKEYGTVSLCAETDQINQGYHKKECGNIWFERLSCMVAIYMMRSIYNKLRQ